MRNRTVRHRQFVVVRLCYRTRQNGPRAAPCRRAEATILLMCVPDYGSDPEKNGVAFVKADSTHRGVFMSRNFTLRNRAALCGFFFLLGSAAPGLLGQGATAAISGTIADSTGAVITEA